MPCPVNPFIYNRTMTRPIRNILFSAAGLALFCLAGLIAGYLHWMIDNWRIFGLALLIIVVLEATLSVFVNFVLPFLLKLFSRTTTIVFAYVFSVTIFFLLINILTHLF